MFSLSNLNVKGKLAVLCFTFIAGTVMFAAVSYTTIRSLGIGSERYSSLAELRLLQADISLSEATSLPSNIWVFRMLLAGSHEEVQHDIEHFREVVRKSQEKRSWWMNRLEDGPIKEELLKTSALVDDYFQTVENRIVPLVLAGKMEEALRLRHDTIMPQNLAVEAAIVELGKHLNEEVKRQEVNAEATGRQRIIFTFTVPLICLLISTVLAWIIASGVVNRLREKVKVLKRVRDGDLSCRLKIDARDEIGELAQVIDDMIGGLASIVSEIHANSRARWPAPRRESPRVRPKPPGSPGLPSDLPIRLAPR